MIDPEVPEAARRELEQASLSALAGFSDPLPGPEPAGGQGDAGDPVRVPGARAAAAAIVGVMVVLFSVGLASPGPFSADLVFLALLIGIPCAAAGGLHLLRKAAGVGPELRGGPPWGRPGAAVAYRGRYVVPELDLRGTSWPGGSGPARRPGRSGRRSR